MKNVVFLLFVGAFILASCEKDPDFSKQSNEFIVLTKYDDTYNFRNSPNTYYISDTITLVSDDAVNPKWSDANSAQIIEQIKSNLSNYGYTNVPYANIRVNGEYAPQYFISVTAFQDISTVIYTNPYWYSWYDYYWWWGGYYPYYPYYPWVTGYSYSTGTTIIEMTDMQASPNATPGSPVGGHPIRWNAVMGGLLGSGDDLLYEKSAIDDAFTQSPYLNLK